MKITHSGMEDAFSMLIMFILIVAVLCLGVAIALGTVPVESLDMALGEHVSSVIVQTRNTLLA